MFLVGMIMLHQKKYLLVHLLGRFHLGYMVVFPNMVVFSVVSGWLKRFSRFYSDVGVDPR